MTFSNLMAELLDPQHILTQLPYALLVLSMLMSDIGWLRAIAILSGLVRIINRAFIDVDPVIVLWEVLFVSVNLVQLTILLYYRRRHQFTEDERKLVASMPADVERHAIRRLFRLSEVREAKVGDALTAQGKPVDSLIFIAEGVAQVERDGRIIAVCGPGDFIGEMSFMSNSSATATVIAARAMRYFAFDQRRLQQAQANDGELQRALEASLARNLVGKLRRTSESTFPATQA